MLEFVPETVYRISKHYAKNGQRMPPLYVKLYVYQMCRALGYIHSLGVCHRDIKPQVRPVTATACACWPLCGGQQAPAWGCPGTRILLPWSLPWCCA